MSGSELIALVADWGPPLLGLLAFLSCLALPAPATLAMLAGGAFAASGELSVWTVALAAFAGAVAGDQVAYFGAGALSRWGPVARFLEARSEGMDRARDFVARRGAWGVFLSRWLFSPLSAYVSFAAGLTGMRYGAYLIGDVAGEAVWVALYVGLGWAFAGSIEAVADAASWITGALALALLIGAGIWWWRRRR